MDPIDHLSKLLNDLPGIGPRQAKRLAYALILKPREYTEDLSRMIQEVKREISNCSSCFRFISKKNLVGGLCSICRNPERDQNQLMIVCRDIDMQSVEKSGVFKGNYFVLGGSVPVLDKNPEQMIRLRELEHFLKNKVDDKTGLEEIILAYNQTAEGEHTARVIEEKFQDFAKEHNIKISHLGRGLSTGTELEYSDNETLRNALRNRG
ncbi:MAG: toprim domain-containing protein [Candidatus Paceibacterota bacterium]|jgi:recombination protein RecR